MMDRYEFTGISAVITKDNKTGEWVKYEEANKEIGKLKEAIGLVLIEVCNMIPDKDYKVSRQKVDEFLKDF